MTNMTIQQLNKSSIFVTLLSRLFLFLLLFIGMNSPLHAQANIKITGQSLSQLQSIPILVIDLPNFPNYRTNPTSIAAPPLAAIFKNHTNIPNATMPKAWAYEDLAFFCKIEVQMEKTAKLPIKFRIGEVQQVEKMEGKLK